ncbi:KRUF family protein [Toxoplasma gondii]|uniref:KRUF family protein n=1 Tax=Toxoplasma gondii TaxID=5811 RepID=A0A7J6JUF4_TOXGO|nr:KRUF family protein [Toxoplasma gondii]
MVAWPVVVGTTLVGLTYLLHAVVYGLTSTSWNTAPSALCRVLCTASLGFVGISNSFLGALGARVPDDGDLDKPAFQQSLAGSQSQETTSPESPASTSSTDTVPVPPVSSPTPESSDRRSHRQGIAASPRSEGGAASGRSAVGGLGLARIVTVSGRGTLTLGELAMEQFRRQAMELREEWEDEERYVRRNVGRVIVNQSSRPTISGVQKSTASARNRFRMRSLARLQEAARLESMASEIAAKLLAAGVDLSHVPGDASLTPGASDQGPRVGGDAAAPGNL